MEQQMKELRSIYGDLLQENVSISNYTSVQIGGIVRGLFIAHSAAELEHIMSDAWRLEIPVILLGSGSNILLEDRDFPGLAIVNRAQQVKIETYNNQPSVWAESGASLIRMVNQVAQQGLSGLEWASGIPGSVGGAIAGNAGAFGGEVKDSLILAEILHRFTGKETWNVEKFEFGYRTSILKRSQEKAVVLCGRFRLQQSTSENVQNKIAELTAKRQKNTPPGSSMGCIFKNPPGNQAGKLIDAAGLKGTRIGAVEISPVHANFFINHGGASAEDYRKLIDLVKTTVKAKFDVDLELEVEIIGFQETYGLKND